MGGPAGHAPVQSDGSEPYGKLIPIDPDTQGAVCPESVGITLLSAILDLKIELAGDPTPGLERPGAIELGEELVDQLEHMSTSSSRVSFRARVVPESLEDTTAHRPSPTQGDQLELLGP